MAKSYQDMTNQDFADHFHEEIIKTSTELHVAKCKLDLVQSGDKDAYNTASAEVARLKTKREAEIKAKEALQQIDQLRADVARMYTTRDGKRVMETCIKSLILGIIEKARNEQVKNDPLQYEYEYAYSSACNDIKAEILKNTDIDHCEAAKGGA